jgi:hypothetical protein
MQVRVAVVVVVVQSVEQVMALPQVTAVQDLAIQLLVHL